MEGDARPIRNRTGVDRTRRDFRNVFIFRVMILPGFDSRGLPFQRPGKQILLIIDFQFSPPSTGLREIYREVTGFGAFD